MIEVEVRGRLNQDQYDRLKHFMTEHGQHVALQDTDLNNAKEIAKAFGCKQAIKMVRGKDVYTYHGIEWSIVRCPKNIYYYEAEQAIADNGTAAEVQKHLTEEAKQLDLEVLDGEQTRQFIALLDNEVNEVIDL